MSDNIIHGFGAEGALSPGAQLGLEAWWASKLPAQNAAVTHPPTSGTLNLDPEVGTHIVTLSGATTVTVGAADEGALVQVVILAGGEDVTLPDVDGWAGAYTIPDRASLLLQHLSGEWVLMSILSGSGVASPTDTVPGVVPGLTVGSTTDTTIALTWGAATAVGAITYHVRAWPVGTLVGDRGAWTDATGLSLTLTGLVPSTDYVIEIYASTSAGSGPVSSESAATDAGWSLWAGDAFAGAAATVNNRTIPEGISGQTWTNADQWDLDGAGKAAYTLNSWGQPVTVNLPTLTRERVKVTMTGVTATGGAEVYIGYMETNSAVGTAGGVPREIAFNVGVGGSVYTNWAGGSSLGYQAGAAFNVTGQVFDFEVDCHVGYAVMYVNGVEVGRLTTIDGAPCGPSTKAKWNANLIASVERVDVEVL